MNIALVVVTHARLVFAVSFDADEITVSYIFETISANHSRRLNAVREAGVAKAGRFDR